MAKLAVFCDGTWNGVRMTHLTNVARLARSVAPFWVNPETGNRVRQVVFYDEGVGVKSGVSRINDEIEKLAGGAFGRGLDHRIESAYRFIAMNYKPDEDELYVFGFSRGAYTARSLCGLIRKCGILKRENLREIPNAMKLYRDRKTHPSGPECIAFRKQFAHDQLTGMEELTDAERRLSNRTRDIAAKKFDIDPSQVELTIPEAARIRTVKIRYLGLWDTVGAMGIPNRFYFLRAVNRKYEFHDAAASRLIDSVRHAAAVDEDRRVFDISPVSNTHALNIAAASKMVPPRQVMAADKPDYLSYDERPYQQKWFPGDHGAVGGGNIEPGLSSAALLWVMDGAEKAGLSFSDGADGEIAEAQRLQNPLAEFRIRKDGTPKGPLALDFLGLAGAYKPRYCPLTPDELHTSTWIRLFGSENYRPPILKRFSGKTRIAPHRVLATLLAPFVRVGLVVMIALVVLAGAFVVWSVGKGLEYVIAHPRETVSEILEMLRWLMPFLPRGG
jgi:uncharacterized protein (DUF2235 family)